MMRLYVAVEKTRSDGPFWPEWGGSPSGWTRRRE